MRPYIVHMTGEKFREALDKLGWDMPQTMQYLDQDRRRIQQWLHDEHRIPRWVPTLLALVDLPGGPARLKAVDQHLARQQNDQMKEMERC